MQASELQRGSIRTQHRRLSPAPYGLVQGTKHVCILTLLLCFAAVISAQTPAPAPAVSPAPVAPPLPQQPNTVPPTNSTLPSPATPPAAASAAASAPGVDAAHYIIGPEDNLQITVWKEPTLSGVVPVRPDGMISMVLLGDLPAAGSTPMQLTSDITNKLKKYIQDPIVSVLVTGVNSRKIYFVGEVNRVGPLSLGSDMTLLQAISAAGGVTTFAHSKRIYILRGSKGHEQKIFFNYKQALKGDSRQDIALQPGDTIVVP